MGWYIRKSKSFGPLRVNLSKSGIGMSVGVKGARVSFGPNGTYLNAGRNGLYYRKKLGNGLSDDKESKDVGYRDNVNPQSGSNSFEQDADAIRVNYSACSGSELGETLVSEIKKARVRRWLWIIGSLLLITYGNIYGILIATTIGVIFWRSFSARVDYDLEQDDEVEWHKLVDAMLVLDNSERLWLIEKEWEGVNRKTNAGAGKKVARGDAQICSFLENVRTGFGIQTNIETVAIKSSKCKILFLPNGVFIKKGTTTVAYPYDQISILSTTVSFVEDEHLTNDAEVLRYTWRYVNKDGSPDRRFNGNSQLPVCKYGVIVLRGSGINIELESSNNAVVTNISGAYVHYKTNLNNPVIARPQQSKEDETTEQIRRNEMIQKMIESGLKLQSEKKPEQDDPYDNLFLTKIEHVKNDSDHNSGASEADDNDINDIFDYFEED